jgi:hypothetical protein
LKHTYEGSTKKDFRLDYIKQILSVAPNFFNHKWEQKESGMELVFSIPQNIKEILETKDPASVPASQFSLETKMDETLLIMRRAVFKKLLQKLAVAKFRERYPNADVYLLDSWPSSFEKEDFQIPLFKLKEQPTSKRSIQAEILASTANEHGSDLREAIN